jgi:hypothetical protein
VLLSKFPLVSWGYFAGETRMKPSKEGQNGGDFAGKAGRGFRGVCEKSVWTVDLRPNYRGCQSRVKALWMTQESKKGNKVPKISRVTPSQVQSRMRVVVVESWVKKS